MIPGLAGLCGRLEGARAAVESAVSAELAAVAREAMELARENAPVGEGPRRDRRLVDSFSYEHEGLTAVMRVDNPHAAYVEFGTGQRGAASAGAAPGEGGYDPDWPGMCAQPYMYPAAQQMRPGFAGRMLKAALEGLMTGRNADEESA